NEYLSLSPADLLDIFEGHNIARKKLRNELQLFMRGERNVDKYKEVGINWSKLRGFSNENSRFYKGDRRWNLPQFTPEALKHNMPLVALVKKWAQRKGITPAQFALAWMLSRKSWIVPIPGTTNPDHLDDFLGAGNVRLASYEMEEFDKEYAKIDLMGHRADPFTESQIDK
ncbi:MAG: aldo/keto reductase, partial [Bacteroides sp.]|nr:aldo/keto reductase [Bacteroides sp.]